MQKISIFKLNDDLEARARRERIPFSVSIELTYGCNLKCAHCYNPTHQALPKETKTPELFRYLDQLPELGCFNVLFTGGEPLTRPDAFEIFEYAKNLGLQVLIYTNATLLDKEKVEKLVALGPSQVSVSAYGHTKEVYEKVTGVPGSYEKFIEGRDLLLKTDLPVHFKMAVMTYNHHELETLNDWYRDQGIPFSHSLDISPRVDGNLEPLNVRLSTELSTKYRLAYDNPANAEKCGRSESGKVFDCNCGQTSVAISPYGEMNLCTAYANPEFDLTGKSLKEGWKAMVNLVENAKANDSFKCTTCDVSEHCTQGAVDAWLETKDYSPCLPYYKEVATKVKEGIEEK